MKGKSSLQDGKAPGDGPSPPHFPFTVVLGQDGAIHLGLTSKELLLLTETLALLVTDLPPVFCREPLHGQLQILFLLSYKVPVL